MWRGRPKFEVSCWRQCSVKLTDRMNPQVSCVEEVEKNVEKEGNT